jgi:hypothetical protein
MGVDIDLKQIEFVIYTGFFRAAIDHDGCPLCCKGLPSGRREGTSPYLQAAHRQPRYQPLNWR